MSRYFYYLVTIELICSFISVTPSFLYDSSRHGALLSLLLALIIGLIFLLATTAIFNRFPGVGLPELLRLHMPNWITRPLLFMLSAVWFVIGIKTIISYSFLLKRFLTPYLSMTSITALLLLFITYSFFMKSRKLLYSLEIVLIINLPIIIYIIILLYMNHGLNWDYIKKSVMYAYHTPSYQAFSAAFFSFLGVANLVIFNREFQQKQRMTIFHMLLLLMLSTSILLTAYFIPIGYNGLDRIQNMSFPWLLTADSIKVSIAFLERVMYIFLFLNLSVAFISIIITWHVSLQMIKSMVLPKKPTDEQHLLGSSIFGLLVWVTCLFISNRISEIQFLTVTSYLYNVIPIIFLSILIICWVISWRDKRASISNS